MEEDFLKYEHWEGVFDQFRPPPPNLLQRISTAFYPQVKNTLFFPNTSNWRTRLIALAIVSAALNILRYHRQYTHLTRQAIIPKPLQNIITNNAFRKSQSRQRTALRFACFRALYRLAVQILLVSTGVLPWLWTGIEEARQREGIWKAANAFEIQFGHTVNTVVFYLCCAVLWTVGMLPVTYCESYVLDLGSKSASEGKDKVEGESESKGEGESDGKPTLWKWLSGIAWAQGVIFLKIWLFLYYAEVDLLLHGMEATLKTNFYILLARPLAHALAFMVLAIWPARGVVPLREGNTKKAIQKMAREEGVHLAGIYCSTEGRGKAGEGSVVKLYGSPWKRSVVLSEKILERCDTEEVVALTAFELVNSKHNLSLGFVTVVAYHWGRLLCLLVLLFNWRNLCESFGFGTEFSYSSQHPFQVIILVVGGAIDPLLEAIDALARALGDKFESDADKVAAQKGYSHHLAKAIIKLEKDDMEVVDLEDVYLHVRSNGQDLRERLDRLQWTGEERMGEEGKQHYHWEAE